MVGVEMVEVVGRLPCDLMGMASNLTWHDNWIGTLFNLECVNKEFDHGIGETYEIVIATKSNKG
jgi:hypothetical protein